MIVETTPPLELLLEPILSEITQAARAAYLAAGGVKCPFCGSADISGGFVNIDADGASQRVECQSCGRHWFDLYRLSDVLTDREVDEQAASLIAMAGAGQKNGELRPPSRTVGPSHE